MPSSFVAVEKKHTVAYLSLNRLLNGILSCSRCYFVQFQSISQKFNSCVTEERCVNASKNEDEKISEQEKTFKDLQNPKKTSQLFTSALPLVQQMLSAYSFCMSVR